MPTRKGVIAQQTYSELYGMIVGLYGDPAEIVASPDATMDATFSLISSDMQNDIDIFRVVGRLFWSRVLLVELLTPFDAANNLSNLVLVARPRSLWLYHKTNNNVADFVGNTMDATKMGKEGEEINIVQTNPPYRYGDVIRIAALPAPIDLSYPTSFSDNYYRFSETFDGTTPRNPFLPTPGGNGLQILGATYNPSKYENFTVSEILYYDKNVDARTRIVSGTEDTGETVTLSLCIGGVQSIYKVKGTRIG